MRGTRNVLLVMVCLGSLLRAGNGTAQDTRPGEVVSGISVTREEAAPDHLRVEVCGPDATRLRHGFPLVFELRVPVRGIVVRNSDAGMLVGARAAGQHARVTLTRDPFIPPAPWRVVVLLRVEGGVCGRGVSWWAPPDTRSQHHCPSAAPLLCWAQDVRTAMPAAFWWDILSVWNTMAEQGIPVPNPELYKQWRDSGLMAGTGSYREWLEEQGIRSDATPLVD